MSPISLLFRMKQGNRRRVHTGYLARALGLYTSYLYCHENVSSYIAFNIYQLGAEGSILIPQVV